MNFIELITAVKSAVSAIEAVMVGVPGSDKLEATLHLLSTEVERIEAKVPAIKALISAVVAVYNMLGVFKHKSN